MEKRINLIYGNTILNLSYRLQEGGDESIVLIHGLGSCKDCFRDIWGFPGYQRYTILTFDLPGFGDSDKSHNFSYGMEDHASIVKLLIQELNLGRVHIVGHSMGGAIGLLLAMEVGSFAKSFICLEGNLIGDDCGGSRSAIKYSLEEFERQGFHDLKSRISASEDTLFVGCLSKCDPYAFYKSSESLVKWSDSGKLL